MLYIKIQPNILLHLLRTNFKFGNEWNVTQLKIKCCSLPTSTVLWLFWKFSDVSRTLGVRLKSWKFCNSHWKQFHLPSIYQVDKLKFIDLHSVPIQNYSVNANQPLKKMFTSSPPLWRNLHIFSIFLLRAHRFNDALLAKFDLCGCHCQLMMLDDPHRTGCRGTKYAQS